MKIEQLLVQHLYNSKEATLQGIGTFRLNPKVSLPFADDKDFVMPADAISFEYNLRATEDEALIDYIVHHTRKIKPLASSDLDSYVMLAKQFLNIGKPLVIEGIGTVQKNQQGEYEFIPGNLVPVKTEDAPNQFTEKQEEAVSFRSESNSHKRRISFTLPVPLLILVLFIVGLIVFYFIHKKNHAPVVTNEIPVVVAPFVVKADTVVKKDTLKPAVVDSSLLKPVVIAKDGFNFKVVIKEYPDSFKANKAFQKLQFTKYANRIILYKTDSTYKIAVPFTTPLSDTTNERDSIHTFFQGNTRIEL